MNTASSFDSLPQEVRLLHKKLEVIAAKIDTMTSQAQKPDDTLIGVDEAAKLLGVSKGGIYSKVYRNIIPYLQVRGGSSTSLSRNFFRKFSLTDTQSIPHQQDRSRSSCKGTNAYWVLI